MVRIAPFRGVFYNQKKIHDLSKVIAPPYDVISKEEQEKLYRRSPYNFVRLDLSQEPDSYDAVAKRFADWEAEGIFERDETPAIYFLTQRFSLKGSEEKERQGFFALTELEEFSSGKIRPHEKTLDAPKEDRLRLMLACQAQFSPIFTLYAQPKQTINRALARRVEGSAPFIEIDQEGDGQCRLWRITDSALLQQVQQEMKDQLLLQLEEALQTYFYLEQYPKTPEGKGWFLKALRTGGKKQRLIGASFKRDPRYLILRLKNKRIMQRLAKELSAPLRELDVSTLHLLILEHILGMAPETQASEANIRYTQDEEAALQRLEQDDYQAAFILNAPKAEEILAIVSAGEK